eukprot:1846702-Rhodomonas_salina.1
MCGIVERIRRGCYLAPEFVLVAPDLHARDVRRCERWVRASEVQDQTSFNICGLICWLTDSICVDEFGFGMRNHDHRRRADIGIRLELESGDLALRFGGLSSDQVWRVERSCLEGRVIPGGERLHRRET